MSITDALWHWPLSAILQMIHAVGVSRGNDYDWTHAGEPSEEIMNQFDEMANMSIDDLI